MGEWHCGGEYLLLLEYLCLMMTWDCDGMWHAPSKLMWTWKNVTCTSQADMNVRMWPIHSKLVWMWWNMTYTFQAGVNVRECELHIPSTYECEGTWPSHPRQMLRFIPSTNYGESQFSSITYNCHVMIDNLHHHYLSSVYYNSLAISMGWMKRRMSIHLLWKSMYRSEVSNPDSLSISRI